MFCEFYKDTEVFITGGSGIIGKAAIEKLLRSFETKKIYILLRGKNQLNVEQRLEKMKNDKIFRLLKSTKPNALDKLVAIPGDAGLPILGITLKYAQLMANVSIVFHCAATVRFDESLKNAVNLNVGGTYETLKFAETLKNLKMFMHVSTFFSNPNLKFIEPKLYPAPMDWKLCLEMVKDESKVDQVDALTRKIIMGFPNTYCFTKNLAENVVNSFRERLPLAIYRPSVVTAAITEPEPGYPSALMGPMAVFVLVTAGLLKCIHAKDNVRLDLIPLDLCTNVMLAVTVLAKKQYDAGNVLNIPVYLGSSCGHLKQTFQYMFAMLQANHIYKECAFLKSLLIPYCYFTSNRSIYMILVFTHQFIPAMLVDGLLMLFGQKPALMGIARKSYVGLEVIKPFLFNEYLSAGVTNEDEIYELTKSADIQFKDVVDYASKDDAIMLNMRDMILKSRDVLLNEDISTLGQAQKLLMIKKIIYQVGRAILGFYLLRWLYRRLLVNYFN